MHQTVQVLHTNSKCRNTITQRLVLRAAIFFLILKSRKSESIPTNFDNVLPWVQSKLAYQISTKYLTNCYLQVGHKSTWAHIRRTEGHTSLELFKKLLCGSSYKPFWMLGKFSQAEYTTLVVKGIKIRFNQACALICLW